MKIKVTELTPEYIKFTLSDTTVAYANALRRIMISEVPTIAIDLVEILKNNTVLPDEVLAHRLGLIPISVTKDLKYKDECGCNDICDECSLIFEVDVVHHDETPYVVTAKDIRTTDNSGAYFSTEPVIAKLAKDQGLKVKCIARKGTGKMHSKWSPVTAINFEYDPANKRRETNFWYEASVEQEWPGASEESEMDKKIDSVDMCVEVVEGSLSPQQVVIKALEILKEKISSVSNSIEA